MIRPFRSFYARLSSLFLVLTVALGAGFIAIAFNSAEHLFDDVEQLLNRDYAAAIAEELAPLVSKGFQNGPIQEAIHYMMVLNPRVEIYLLGADGRVLAWFGNPADRLVRISVDTRPLEAFITGGRRLPILGDDPRSSSRSKPFSAAPLRIGDERGFVYVILGGQLFDRSLNAVRESYYLRAGLAAVLAALGVTVVTGLALFFLLTRRLTLLSQAVRAFKAGDLRRRVAAGSRDELGDLGRSFNDMAAALEAGMEKLRLSQRMRRELIANISHDLRGPIASLRGSLETIVLKDAELGPEERRKYMEVGLRSTDSLGKLVDELFELVSLETRQKRPRREAFPLSELVQDVVLKLRPRAEKVPVRLEAVSPPGIPLVSADIGMIERLLSNLIDNALGFTPAGGSVRVELSPRDGFVYVCVADTGMGIAPEDLPRIFDRFYRADKSRNRSGGAGLGLAIAKEIAELHGGTLTAESFPGQGARFTFRLPIAT
jgi:signal transduction histidine kinase